MNNYPPKEEVMLTDLIITEGVPPHVERAFGLLHEFVGGGRAPNTFEVDFIQEAFSCYGFIGANGEPVAWGNATVADLEAAKRRAMSSVAKAEATLAKLEHRSEELKNRD
jgi:hypothetical protein